MIKVLEGPRKYVQGADVLAEAGKWILPIGRRALVVWGRETRAQVGATLEASLRAAGIEIVEYECSGWCTHSQIDAGIARGKAEGIDVTVGVGGGRSIDMAKAIAWGINGKVVTVPTIASNDAPTSAETVYYTEDGTMAGWDCWPANPDLVLVDTKVIAQAPVAWLVAGMGDALSTWFEAEAAYKGRRTTIAGGVATMAAMHLARLCYDTLMECGVQARQDAARHVVTPAVDRIIEANTLLSGLGFESAGVCTAHAVGNGLTARKETANFSHGQRVAFGVATQLCLDEDISNAERLRVFDWMVAVGLPVTFEELHLAGISEPEIMALAEAFAGPGSIAHNHVFAITPFDLYSAMMAADALGQERRRLAAAGN
jgi:glycerol dehydrogenase